MASRLNWKWTGSETSWQDWAAFVLGLWLIASPWIVGFGDLTAAMWNGVLGGIVVAVLAMAAILQYREWEEWVDGLVGVWFVLSPWILGFAGFAAETATGHLGASINFVLAGLIAMGLSAWSLVDHRDRSAKA